MHPFEERDMDVRQERMDGPFEQQSLLGDRSVRIAFSVALCGRSERRVGERMGDAIEWLCRAVRRHHCRQAGWEDAPELRVSLAERKATRFDFVFLRVQVQARLQLLRLDFFDR